jgi:hypothetical protein
VPELRAAQAHSAQADAAREAVRQLHATLTDARQRPSGHAPAPRNPARADFPHPLADALKATPSTSGTPHSRPHPPRPPTRTRPPTRLNSKTGIFVNSLTVPESRLTFRPGRPQRRGEGSWN